MAVAFSKILQIFLLFTDTNMIDPYNVPSQKNSTSTESTLKNSSNYSSSVLAQISSAYMHNINGCEYSPQSS